MSLSQGPGLSLSQGPGLSLSQGPGPGLGHQDGLGLGHQDGLGLGHHDGHDLDDLGLTTLGTPSRSPWLLVPYPVQYPESKCVVGLNKGLPSL